MFNLAREVETFTPTTGLLPGTYRIHDLTLNNRSRSISIAGRTVQLQTTTYRVGLCLLFNEGLICTRESMLAAVWGISTAIETRRIDVHVASFRQALASLDSKITIITIRTEGYLADFQND